MKLKGIIVSGSGEGAYFLSLEGYKKGFEKKIGFVPFEGTLNIRISDDEIGKILMLKKRKSIEIPGFEYKGRQYFQIKVFRAKVKESEGAVIFPLLDHHPDNIVEFVAKENLRKKYNLKDGEKIEIEIYG
ncbi:MAG: DUF120 domain-containing protein [Candidatus Micrarchaeota archaeon]